MHIDMQRTSIIYIYCKLFQLKQVPRQLNNADLFIYAIPWNFLRNTRDMNNITRKYKNNSSKNIKNKTQTRSMQEKHFSIFPWSLFFVASCLFWSPFSFQNQVLEMKCYYFVIFHKCFSCFLIKNFQYSRPPPQTFKIKIEESEIKMKKTENINRGRKSTKKNRGI